MAQATIAAREVAKSERPGLWDRICCAVGHCRLRWRMWKEGPTVCNGIQTGWYRTYEGTCPICKRSQLKMEKAT